MAIFHKLFLYRGLAEQDGLIYFRDISLHKIFPDDNFAPGVGSLTVILEPVTGSVTLANITTGKKSAQVSLKDWKESDGLCRSDTPSLWIHK